MRRRYFNNRIINNKIILYTSSDNLIIVPTFYNFGVVVITNTMSNNIGKITCADSVTEIGNYAFRNCSSLTSITIPDSVTWIGNRACEACTSLTSVTIPDSVKSIGNYAFLSCRSLKEVYCKATTPSSLAGISVFSNNSSDRKIYVPTESVSAYKSASGWSEYADAIEGYNF